MLFHISFVKVHDVLLRRKDYVHNTQYKVTHQKNTQHLLLIMGSYQYSLSAMYVNPFAGGKTYREKHTSICTLHLKP